MKKEIVKALVTIGALLASVSSTAADSLKADRLVMLGKRDYTQGRFEQAIERLTRAIAINPNDTKAYLWRGNSFAEKKPADRDAAMRDYDLAIALDPKLPQARFARALLLTEMGNPEEALREYSAAIELKPDYGFAFINRGRLLLAYKRPVEAVEDLSAAIRLIPNDYRGYYWRAYAWLALDDQRQAVADFAAVVRLGAKDPRIYNDYAWILATSEDPAIRNAALAVRLAEQAKRLEKSPENLKKIYDTLATAYEKTGQLDLSRKYRELHTKAAGSHGTRQ